MRIPKLSVSLTFRTFSLSLILVTGISSYHILAYSASTQNRTGFALVEADDREPPRNAWGLVVSRVKVNSLKITLEN